MREMPVTLTDPHPSAVGRASALGPDGRWRHGSGLLASGLLGNGAVRGRVWMALGAWTALWAMLHVVHAGFSWRFFSLGAQSLTSESPTSGGLHVYAAHPELQFGPIALLAAVPLSYLGPWHGRLAAVMLLSASGPLLLAAAVRIRERSAPLSDPLLLVTGLLVLPVWTEVGAHYAHLDDVLAIAAVLFAIDAIRRGSAVATGALLAVATDSKPWALACGALLLALPSGRRARGALVFAAGVALAWIPFVLADPNTLNLGQFTIPNVAGSALQALGVHAARTPFWDRGAQLVLGVAVAALAVRHGRWPAVLLAVVAARLLLDPQTYAYYTTGLVVAAALVDLYVPRRGFPIWTAGAVLFYAADELLRPLLPAHLLGLLRAGYCLAVLAAIALPGRQANAIGMPVLRFRRHSTASPNRLPDPPRPVPVS